MGSRDYGTKNNQNAWWAHIKFSEYKQCKLKTKKKVVIIIEMHNRYYTIYDLKGMHNIYHQINISNINMSLYNY